MISRISSSPSPLSHILSVTDEKYSSGRKKSPPSRYRGVVYPQFRKKTAHSLQVKGLYHRAGTDHLKRLKIKNQLRKWLKRIIVTAEGWSLFWGVWEHARQEKFWKFMLQMRPFGAILHHLVFFFHLLKSINFLRLWLDKDIRNGELLIYNHLYPFVGSSSWQNTEIWDLLFIYWAEKSSVLKVSGFSMHTSKCSRHEHREYSNSFAVTFGCRFHKGINMPTPQS